MLCDCQTVIVILMDVGVIPYSPGLQWLLFTWNMLALFGLWVVM